MFLIKSSFAYIFFFFLKITLFTVLLLTLAFGLWVWDVRGFERDIKSKGKQMADIIGAFSGDSFDAESRITVSMLMTQLVKNSEDPAWDFRIKEIFLLDLNGRPISHSNAMRMARTERGRYQKPEYQAVLEQPREKPILVRTLAHQPTDTINLLSWIDSVWLPLGDLLRAVLPELEKIASEYHISASCYLPNASQPISSLHFIAEPKHLSPYLNPLHYYEYKYDRGIGLVTEGDYQEIIDDYGYWIILGSLFMVFVWFLRKKRYFPFRRAEEKQWPNPVYLLPSTPTQRPHYQEQAAGPETQPEYYRPVPPTLPQQHYRQPTPPPKPQSYTPVEQPAYIAEAIPLGPDNS